MLQQKKYRIYYTIDGVDAVGVLRASNKTAARAEAKRVLEKRAIIRKVALSR